MNAILLALSLTGVVILDYWDFLANIKKFRDQDRTFKVKAVIVLFLLAFGWIQAWMQFCRDSQSDTDMRYVKGQLTLANVSLTNATDTVKGLSIGGDSYAEIGVLQSDTDSNSMKVSIYTVGNYPARDLRIEIKNLTGGFQAQLRHAAVIPPSELIYGCFFGDLPLFTAPTLCNIPLDPSVTNRYRFNISELNGFSQEIVDYELTTNGWRGELRGLYRRVGNKITIEPTNSIIGVPE